MKMKELEIKIKGIIDIINKLNDIDTIVSFDSLKESDIVINGYWLYISIDFKGKIKQASFYFLDDSNVLDSLFSKIKFTIAKVGGYIG